MTTFEVAVKNGLNIKPNQHKQFLSKSVKCIVVNIIKFFYLRSKYLGRQKLFYRSILVVQAALVIREFVVVTFCQNRIMREYCIAPKWLFKAGFDIKYFQKSRISERKSAKYEGHLNMGLQIAFDSFVSLC